VTIGSLDSFGWAAQVHQATGMIVAQAGVDRVEALILLLAHADSHGQSVEATAVEVVERRLRFDGP
jgi:hypothetical protein